MNKQIHLLSALGLSSAMMIGSATALFAQSSNDPNDDQGNLFAGFTAAGKIAVRRFVRN